MHPAADFTEGAVKAFASDYRFALDAGPQPKIEERRRNGSVAVHRPVLAIGQAPLRQFLIETRPGTFQVTEIAWDPAKQEWFDTFPPTEERNPGEWGHWTGQSMNWNSMCARCHMTVYQKGYDEVRQRYQSTWVEQGIGCVQCHGPMTGHEKGGKAMVGVPNISRDVRRLPRARRRPHRLVPARCGLRGSPTARIDDRSALLPRRRADPRRGF